MHTEELKNTITALLAPAVYDETGEWLLVLVEPQYWEALANSLRHLPSLQMDYLFCCTCIDWKTHFHMVYHLTSTLYRHTVVVKVKLDRVQTEIDSVSNIWKTAIFHEREVYDLFGVQFKDHPDLRRLFLTDEWNGYPLRKDYEDPVNMIKL